MRLAILTVSAVLLSLAAAAGELKPVDGAPPTYGGGQLKAADKPARELSKQPAWKSDKPLYLLVPAGGRAELGVVAALDESKGTGTGYDTLRVDANNNGDLTDDSVEVEVRQQGNATVMNVKRTVVTVKYEDGGQQQLAMSLMLYGIKPPSGGPMTWYARGQILQHLEGKVELDGKEVLAGLYDSASRTAAANGRFSDFGTDRLRLDLDGDGKLADTEEMVLSRLLPAGGKLYELELNASATRLALKPYTGATGEVSVSFGFAEGTKVTGGKLVFTGKDGTALSWDAGKGGALQLPAGSFQLGDGNLTLGDASGGAWQVHLGGSRPFEVPANGTAALKLGGPLKLEPAAAGKAVPGGTVSVTHKLLGACGEAYDGLYRTAPTRGMPTAPAVVLEDPEGGQVVKGNMAYGWGGSCGYSASIPQKIKLGADGTTVLKIKVSADTGPLAGQVSGTGELKVSSQ